MQKKSRTKKHVEYGKQKNNEKEPQNWRTRKQKQRPNPNEKPGPSLPLPYRDDVLVGVMDESNLMP